MFNFSILIFLNLMYIQKFQTGKIIVDGVISEETWNSVSPITDFVEYQPVEGRAAPFKTNVFLGYDDNKFIYCFQML